MQWLILNLEKIQPEAVYYHHCVHKKQNLDLNRFKEVMAMFFLNVSVRI